MHTRNVLIIFAALVLMASCGGHRTNVESVAINPRDTVVVPDYLSGEDSIAYIEDVLLQSPISVEDLLGLAEVHTFEKELFYYDYDNEEMAEEYVDSPAAAHPSHRDSADMRLANRFMRMGKLVAKNGNACDKLQWVAAVDTAIKLFHMDLSDVPADSALLEIERVIDKFSSLSQHEMNFQCYVEAMTDYYRTIEVYRQWLSVVPGNLKTLAKEEYEAWHDLNEARFDLWNDVSYMQEWYSAKPMEIWNYHSYLSINRQAELEVEKRIVLDGKAYNQKGKTVTPKEWEEWIAEESVPMDAELLIKAEMEELLPSESIVALRVNSLRSAFARWLAARQAMAAALPKEQGRSYDNLTADIHCRMIGNLDDLIPY